MSKRTRDKGASYKYAQIKTDLSIQILEGQLRPHERIPSLNELTHKYKVSKITARRALNDLVTEGLVYASRGRGSFVADMGSRKKARTRRMQPGHLGVVFEHASGSFMADIIQGIDEEAFEQGVHINLCLSNNSYEREAENLTRLAEQGVDRIILFMVLQHGESTVNPNVPLYLRLQEQGIRLLLLACDVPGFLIPSIVYDDYNAYRRLVRHMKESGRKRLVYAMRADNASTTSERLRGFKDGLLECGLSYEEKRIVRVPFATSDNLVSDTEEVFGRFISQKVRFDAVICSDEIVAAGVFEAMGTTGLLTSRGPCVGGMGSNRNLHVLKGRPYILLEDDTRKLGREAASIILRDPFPSASTSSEQLRHVIPVPLRLPRR